MEGRKFVPPCLVVDSSVCVCREASDPCAGDAAWAVFMVFSGTASESVTAASRRGRRVFTGGEAFRDWWRVEDGRAAEWLPFAVDGR